MSNLRSGGTRATYSAEHFDPLFAVEERHFWFRSRNRCIGAATRLIPDRDSVEHIVEHGCGTGFVLAELQRLFPRARVVGTDLFAEGLALARRRFAGPLIQTDVLEWKAAEAFDLVGFFDVLEHLDDDVRALRAINEQLRPGGHLLLTVPAHMALWSEYDVVSGHRRRYDRLGLAGCLRGAGFEMKYCTEFMSVLLPLVWVRRRLRRTAPTASDERRLVARELKVIPLFNGLMTWALSWEANWIACRRRLPFGTSLLAVARKRPVASQRPL